MAPALPSHARVVVVGGGIVGCSVAYHLVQAGWSDVVVLEQVVLGGGTTWHSAGMVGRLRTSNALTRINKYSAELYAGLEEATGEPTGWREVGSLLVAQTPERMTQLRRTAGMAELFGVEAHMLGPAEAAERWPLMRSDDLLGGAFLPHDGKVVPDDVARALAAGARAGGASILEGVRVDQLLVANGRAAGVRTDQGDLHAEVVVLAGGMWSRAMGLAAGVDLPLHPVEHHYAVSEPIEGAHDLLPTARDPDAMIYFRTEGDQILLGAFQLRSKPWDVPRVPADFSYQLLEPDWERFEQPLAAGLHRIPALQKSEFPRFVNGPESFTPDNNFLLGETPAVAGLFVAAGFNSVGIASAGGAGRALAEWITNGEQTDDLWSVDVRRFAPFHNARAFLRERVAEVLGLHYQMAWPNLELETGRDQRRTPLHDALAARGAVFGAKFGWERPNWYAPKGEPARTEYSFGRQNWHAAVGAEMRACRERAALFEQSSFGKLELEGGGAGALLQRLCAADVDVEPGRLVYTALLNARGTYESDLTVVRLGEERWRLVTSSSQPVRDLDWIERNMDPGSGLVLRDVSARYGVLGLMGPRARDILERLTDADVSNEGFPFGAARELELGPVRALALRVTYVGELGWELQLPMEELPRAFEAIWEAGAELGLADAGHYAINALRLEKAYRAFGAELSPAENPFEVGLTFNLAWDKPGGFLGREALLERRGQPPPRRICQLVLEDPGPMLWGSEPIRRDGQAVGYTTSGAYGHTLGAAVALGWARNPDGVTADWLRAGSWEVVVDGEPVAARLHLRPAYDPGRERILV